MGILAASSQAMFAGVPYPLVVLAVGIAIVLGMIIGFRVNAFLALITAAVVVSLLSQGETDEKIVRVAGAFGDACGKIGIVIALAAIIGECMMQSGAADKIVRSSVRTFGEKHASIALMLSGFILAVPVFFDTVFYLLVPLARSLYKQTNKNFLLYVMAIAAGGAATHTLVPPTPGPLAVATQLGVSIGIMILVGVVIALPSAILGEVVVSRTLNRWMPVPLRPLPGVVEPEPIDEEKLPSFAVSVLPIVLPVVLICTNAILKASVSAEMVAEDPGWEPVLSIAGLLGDPNVALLFSTVIAMATVIAMRHYSFGQLGHVVETSLMSGGVIILITSAGGAFGSMLKEAQVGPAIEAMFGSEGASGGFSLLWLAYLCAAVLKVAQGSSTVAMITTAGLVSSMLGDQANAASMGESIGYNPVYVATAISAGSLMGSWMNDSGFWIFARMSGLTEAECLKSWTILLAFMSAVGMAATLLMASLFPMI